MRVKLLRDDAGGRCDSSVPASALGLRPAAAGQAIRSRSGSSGAVRRKPVCRRRSAGSRGRGPCSACRRGSGGCSWAVSRWTARRPPGHFQMTAPVNCGSLMTSFSRYSAMSSSSNSISRPRHPWLSSARATLLIRRVDHQVEVRRVFLVESASRTGCAGSPRRRCPGSTSRCRDSRAWSSRRSSFQPVSGACLDALYGRAGHGWCLSVYGYGEPPRSVASGVFRGVIVRLARSGEPIRCVAVVGVPCVAGLQRAVIRPFVSCGEPPGGDSACVLSVVDDVGKRRQLLVFDLVLQVTARTASSG